ncbi:hypothetical protein EKO27_g9278 [Xylaria grammica]|uniref:NADH-ubiquinone oxidoreductase 12 kDa subunit, mitochondrial n=1 Tax=Xylaria grammica TaxID=363999 RepID=A0A439CUK2_9PEZI|nr:hypothetical protein EKO27_g9278 [Xylaria grammica]
MEGSELAPRHELHVTFSLQPLPLLLKYHAIAALCTTTRPSPELLGINPSCPRALPRFNAGRTTTALNYAMPTPESAAFLAKKPSVPPTFEGVDYDDNKRLKQAQDAVVREQWVKIMMGRLVRDELSKCYYREGVNHLEKCGPLRERYLQLLKDNRVRGYLFEQQNYVEGKK